MGKATDMCVIGPYKGTFNLIPDEIVKHLDVFYESYKKKISKMDQKNEEITQDYLTHLTQTTNQIQKVSPSPSASPSNSPSASVSPSASNSPSPS